MSTPVPGPIHTTDHSSFVLRTHGWRTVANSAAYLIPHLKPGMKILDVGCGPGSITVDLARLVPDGHVTGVDHVDDPFEHARSLASSKGITNVTFQVGDIHALDFPDDTFDIVHTHQVLQHVGDPIQGLREMRRVTKPGGIVACREGTAVSWYPPSKGIEEWWALFERMSRARGGHPLEGKCMHVWAEKAGFDQKQIAKSAGAWCFSTPEERENWGGSMAERGKAAGATKAAIEGGFATKEDLEKMAEGWKNFVADENGWLALLHAEIVCTK